MVAFTAYVAIPSKSFFDDPSLHPETRDRESVKAIGGFPIGAIRRHEELIRRSLSFVCIREKDCMVDPLIGDYRHAERHICRLSRLHAQALHGIENGEGIICGGSSPDRSSTIDQSLDQEETSALARWRRLRQAFEKVDVVGAGTVSMCEMVAIMTREDLHMGDEEMLDLMRRYERYCIPPRSIFVPACFSPCSADPSRSHAIASHLPPDL